MRICIIGYGHVGQGMESILTKHHKLIVIDPEKGSKARIEDTHLSDLSIVCVPTPMKPSGECDTSIVEDVIAKIASPLILVKSTVTPGTCERLSLTTNKRIVFSPEYMGESRYWTPLEYPQPNDPVSHGFMILGGHPNDCSVIADVFLPAVGPATRFRFMRATEAELVKYTENSFFALKVTFANELRRMCDIAGVNYHTVREGWLDDPRVGPMHSAAFKESPGFNGKCLPKDLAALEYYCRSIGMRALLLEAIISTNEGLRGE